MPLSVIIPTYNRPQSLLRQLRSLQEQILRCYALLVVDNAADAELARRVAAFNRTARRPVRYVPEPRLGLMEAPHAGARAAGGDILVLPEYPLV